MNTLRQEQITDKRIQFFLPNITASHTGMATTNLLMALGSKLNQEIITTNEFNPRK